MKKIGVGILIALTGVLLWRSCVDYKKEQSILMENTMLIQQQISNVSKLIVTEGHYAQVYTYKDSQQLFGPLLTAQKKALVVVNAEVEVIYDLRKIRFEIDEASKTLHVHDIPPPEIRIHPDFEYYDVSADYLNPFDEEDYNKIKKNVQASLLRKVEASSLKSNARNRLLSELSKFLLLTNTMDWTLSYADKPVSDMEQIALPDKAVVN